jgi:hypothetical protein
MRRIRLTEGQLHRIIINAVNEAKNKGGNGFNSREDMREYLDQYDRTSPYADKRGPYDNENLVFYNDGKSRVPNSVIQDSNAKLYKRLSSKGGQMQHDWEENKPFWSGAHKVKGDTYINGFEHARNLANADYDVHRAYLSDAPVKPYNREFYRDLYVDHDGDDDDSYESPILNDYDYR